MEKENELPLKKCNKCKRTLPITEFYNSRKTIDGKNRYCKKCIKYFQDKSKEKKEIEKYKKMQIINEKKKQEEINNSIDHINTKVCYRCKIEKPLCEFHKDRRSKDGYNNVCIKCKREREAINVLKRLEKRGY